MATKKRAELIARVLKILAVVGSGQSPEVEDYASVDEEIDTILADLSTRSVTHVADADEIEEEIFQNLALRIACSVAPDFSVGAIAGYPGMSIEQVAQFAESRLRMAGGGGPTYQTLKTEYF